VGCGRGAVSIYAGWQPLPQVLWNATGPLRWGLSALFYLAWTLILIGAFLASHLDLFEVTGEAGAAPAAAADDGGFAPALEKRPFMETLRQPLYGGILIAVWATTVMTVGHLLLAAAVTGYLLFDGLWAARKNRTPLAARGTFSLQGERLAR
jgi:methanethiol S-methyltransferase